MPEEVLLQLRIYVQDVITFLKMLSICLGDVTKLRSFGIAFPIGHFLRGILEIKLQILIGFPPQASLEAEI